MDVLFSVNVPVQNFKGKLHQLIKKQTNKNHQKQTLNKTEIKPHLSPPSTNKLKTSGVKKQVSSTQLNRAQLQVGSQLRGCRIHIRQYTKLG